MAVFLNTMAKLGLPTATSRMGEIMFDDIHKGLGCLKCPVDEFECDAQYCGSRCAALRAKAGADFDPKTNADQLLPSLRRKKWMQNVERGRLLDTKRVH